MKNKTTKVAFMAIALMACSFKVYAATLDPNDPETRDFVNEIPLQRTPDWNWMMANDADFRGQYNILVNQENAIAQQNNPYSIDAQAMWNGIRNIGQIQMSDRDLSIIKYTSTAIFLRQCYLFHLHFFLEQDLGCLYFKKELKRD